MPVSLHRSDPLGMRRHGNELNQHNERGQHNKRGKHDHNDHHERSGSQFATLYDADRNSGHLQFDRQHRSERNFLSGAGHERADVR